MPELGRVDGKEPTLREGGKPGEDAVTESQRQRGEMFQVAGGGQFS